MNCYFHTPATKIIKKETLFTIALENINNLGMNLKKDELKILQGKS